MGLRTSPRRLRLGAVAGAMLVTALLAAPAAAQAAGFRQTNLVSDKPGLAMLTDSNLVNPWGLAAGPTTPLWIADNGTDVSTIYPGAAHGMPISIAPLVVSIPGGAPTGTVFNPSTSFKVHVGSQNLPATFIFDSEAGMITAWPFTDPPGTSATAELSVPGAIFKGLALGFVHGRGHLLYAADFHHNQIVVVERAVPPRRISRAASATGACRTATRRSTSRTSAGSCTSPTPSRSRPPRTRSPAPASGSSTSTRGAEFCCTASRSAARSTPPGASRRRRAASAASATPCSSATSATARSTPTTSTPASGSGQLRRPNGHAVQIDGLWGLRFGNGVTGDPKSLLFSAGIDDEAHGLFGVIRAAH